MSHPVSRHVLQLYRIVCAGLLLAVASVAVPADADQERQRAPNILLIVVDDMGFADLGSFGGEIPTPNLDQLAYRGVRFSNFITSSVCSPSRANLLTGVPPHRAGFGNLKEELAPNQSGRPGYEGYLNDRVVTIASLLKDAGYHTYMTGKWHLGTTVETSPWARGFERSFAMLKNASHFADMRPAYSPDPQAKAAYRDGSRLLDRLPANFEYSSQFFVDQLIDYIGDDDDGRPFFALLAFSAPHWPLQAPAASIAEFRGHYDIGYDVVAAQRFGRQKALGLVPPNAVAPRPPPKWRPWSDLDEKQRRESARSMEIYAAMIAEIDRNTGRLFDHLRRSGLFDDTVIIFMSDNGAEGHDLDETWPAEQFPDIRAVIDERHDFSYENMGRPGSYTFYGPGWANASAPAFYLHKGFPSEGGIRTAAFIHPATIVGESGVYDDLVTAGDVACTILDVAKVAHPGSSYRGREVEPMQCQSIRSKGAVMQTVGDERIQVNETMGKIAVRRGAWKITRMPGPYGSGDWELYNLRDDIGESNNVAAQHPAVLRELVEAWNTYMRDNGVILPDWVSGY